MNRARAPPAVFVDLAGAEGVDADGGRLGHADGVGHLDFTAIRQTGGDDVLGDVAGGVGGGAVHLGRVLAGEGATAVMRACRRRCRR
jgi:hypothetical protein